MSDRSSTCADDLAATPNAISSPASASGATPCDAPDGPMTDLFGQALAPASPSATPAKAMSSQMSATYGRHGSGSSASAALALSLASRLQARRLAWLDHVSLTWKARATPSGRSIPALRASARRTSDNACSSWPTPNAGPFENDTDERCWSERRARRRRGERQRLRT
jgi:hypothetical protein